MDKNLILMIIAAIVVFILTVGLILVAFFPNIISNQNELNLTQDDKTIINQINETDLVITPETTTNPFVESEEIIPFEP